MLDIRVMSLHWNFSCLMFSIILPRLNVDNYDNILKVSVPWQCLYLQRQRIVSLFFCVLKDECFETNHCTSKLSSTFCFWWKVTSNGIICNNILSAVREKVPLVLKHLLLTLNQLGPEVSSHFEDHFQEIQQVKG